MNGDGKRTPVNFFLTTLMVGSMVPFPMMSSKQPAELLASERSEAIEVSRSTRFSSDKTVVDGRPASLAHQHDRSREHGNRSSSKE